MTTASGNFAELLWPGIATIFGKEYNQYEPLYTKIFEVKNSDKAFEKDQGVTGLPLASIKEQGSPTPFVDPSQGYQKEYVNVTYGLGATVTREMYDDDQYNYINSLPQMLARSLYQTEETVHFNVLNNGFSTENTADGQTVFNASHNLVGGGTFSNQLATAADLTQTSLEQATQDLLDFVDDQSLKIRVMPKCLVVPTAINHTARRILETHYTTGSADNDINPVYGLFMDLIVSPWLTDTDAWFIVTDCPNGLTHYIRRGEEITRDNEFSTENLQFKTTKRWSQGVTDPRGVFGTPGA